MALLMSFLEAVRNKIILEGDKVDPTECFIKEEKEFTFSKEELNYEQKFFRENLYWYFKKDYKKIPSLYGTTTNSTLSLLGLSGYQNGIYVMQKIATLYSNYSIGCISRAMNVNDFKSSKTDFLLKLGAKSWLSSTYMLTFDDNSTIGGFYVVDGDMAKDYKLFHTTNGYNYYGTYGIRPVLSIFSENICVDLESKKRDGAWKLILPNK